MCLKKKRTLCSRLRLARIFFISLTTTSPQATAEESDLIIDQNQDETVTLSSAGGTVRVLPGVSINPLAAGEIYALGGENAQNWKLLNNGIIHYGIDPYGVAVRMIGSSEIINTGSIYGRRFGIFTGAWDRLQGEHSTYLLNQREGTISADELGVFITDSANVINHGVITGGYSALEASTSLDSEVFSLVNDGLISGDKYAVNLTGYEGTDTTLENKEGGRIVASGGDALFLSNVYRMKIDNQQNALIQGTSRGIHSGSFNSIIDLTNAGIIRGETGPGAYLYDSSDVMNHRSGLIEGSGGILTGRGSTYTLVNEGTLRGNADRLGSDSNASSGNYGSGAGIFSGGSGNLNVLNESEGLIEGGVHGLYHTSLRGTSGTTVLENRGRIYGGEEGILATADRLFITNAGIIEGGNGKAITFSQGADHLSSALSLRTGSDIRGRVTGAARGDTALNVTGQGELNLTDYRQFTSLNVSGPGDRWRFTGSGRFADNASSTVSGVSASGTMIVDGTLEASRITVHPTGELTGSGTLTGDVTVHNGQLRGRQGETLTVNGNLILQGAGIIAELGQPGGAGLFRVNGDLTLDGTLNISDMGGFGAGVYRLFDYSGSLTYSGLSFGTLPSGISPGELEIQTSVDRQVSLINLNGMQLGFWDGEGIAADGVISGGSGVWNNAAARWTDSSGQLNRGWNSQFAVFQGQAGTVLVDSQAGQVSTTGMQFVSDGYEIRGDSLFLTDAQSFFRVGDGKRETPTTATISSELAGEGGLTKTDFGTLILNAASSFQGQTEVRQGNLMIGDANHSGAVLPGRQVSTLPDAVLSGYGTVKGSVINGGTLQAGTAGGPPAHLRIGGDVLNRGTITSANGLAGNRLTISGNYAGENGLISLKANLGDDDSSADRLIVEGDTAGTTRVSVVNAGGDGARTLNGIEVISVGGRSEGEFVQQGRIVAGAFDYRLIRGEGDNRGNWVLSSASGGGTQDPGPGNEHMLRPEGAAYASGLAAANTMFGLRWLDHREENAYRSLRAGEQKPANLWLRNSASRKEWQDSSGQLSTRSYHNVVQLGADVARLNDSTRIGLMAGQASHHSKSQNTTSGKRADASLRGYSAGTYLNWQQNEDGQPGFYAETWLQYGHFRHHVRGDALATESYRSEGVTGSVEYGFGQELVSLPGSDRIFIQPQMQFVWMGVQAGEFRESNGTVVREFGRNNVQSRLGVRLDRRSSASATASPEPFIEGNWIRNSRIFGSQLNGVAVSQQGGRDTGEIRTGVKGGINRHVHLSGLISYQAGGHGYSEAGAQMNLSVSF